MMDDPSLRIIHKEDDLPNPAFRCFLPLALFCPPSFLRDKQVAAVIIPEYGISGTKSLGAL